MSEVEENMTAPAAEPAAEEAPKRRVGRPRKKAAEEPAAEVPAAEAAAEDAPKRRPGRPRKKAAEEPAVEAPAAEDAPEKPARRTRKKAAEEPAAEAVAEAPAPEESAAEKPARRTRRKAADAEAASASADDAATAKEASEEPAEEKKAGEEGERKPRRPRAEGADKDRHQGGQNQQGGQANQENRQGGQNNRGNGRNNNSRRNKRSRGNDPIEPKANREVLAEMKVMELRHLAAELDVDTKVFTKKDELIEAVYQAQLKAEGFLTITGLLDTLPEGYGFLRTSGYLPGEHDAYVHANMIRRNGLRKGDMITGQLRPVRENEKFAALNRIDLVNGRPLEEVRNRVKFADLTPVYPDERLVMEHDPRAITARVIDLVAPIGKGQRGLIVSPPKAGKTTILKDIAASITANNPEIHLMCLLVDERPEEVTDMQRSIHGEVIASTFDMPCENHIAVSELVIERAKRLVELGEDVVILLDSITRLARAYNLAQPASGRILSGGVDSTALYPPKRFLGAARNIENGGSLTILASALIDTGSKMDEVIFEEFKGTGNMELKLDRTLADRRIFPAIDPVTSGTRKEELLMGQQEALFVWGVRRILANLNNTERAMEMLIKSLKQTNSNQEFLIRTARKAQEKNGTTLVVD